MSNYYNTLDTQSQGFITERLDKIDCKLWKLILSLQMPFLEIENIAQELNLSVVK